MSTNRKDRRTKQRMTRRPIRSDGSRFRRFRAAGSLVGLAIVLSTLFACSATPDVASLPTWPVSPELLPEATAVLSAKFGPASWALDPAFASRSADSTELRILAWERACSSGSPATGRMSAPVVEYTPETVTITIGVRPLEVAPGAGLSCPMPPGTPAIVRLPQPLGERTLLDGGHEPPVPPSPANG